MLPAGAETLHRELAMRPRLLGIVGSQFGPDRAPVVGAQILAGDCPIRRALDSYAVLGAGFAIRVPVLPLANLHFALGSDAVLELGHAQRAGGVQVLVQVHLPAVVANAS